jgi:predicted SAM-dependent methyltransferase
MINLNLGSGSNRRVDYISVDLYVPEADVQHDLTTPLPWSENEVDNIYSCHVIEHFTRKEWEFVRRDWARVLKPGGKVEIRCPDLTKLCQNFLNEPDNQLRIDQIYGQQARDGEFHKNGFTEESLRSSFPGFSLILLKPSSDYELHVVLTKPNL